MPQRRLTNQRDLFAQFQDPDSPVALGVELEDSGGEGGVVPAPRDPGRTVDQAHGAQGFDQVQLACVEFLEILEAAATSCKRCPPFGCFPTGGAPGLGGHILFATQVAKTLQHDFRTLFGVDDQRQFRACRAHISLQG